MNKKIIAGIMSVAMLATMSATPIYATGEVGNPGASQSGTSDTIQQNTLPENKTYTNPEQSNLQAVWNKEDKTLTFSSTKEGGEELTKAFVNEAYNQINLSDKLGAEGTFNVVIGGGITRIGESAFCGIPVLGNALNKKISKVTIKDSVQSIGDSAFNICAQLTQITIPSSVTEIGGSAFSGCSALKDINIPSSVTEIGGSAFTGCESLEPINFVDISTLTSLGQCAFDINRDESNNITATVISKNTTYKYSEEYVDGSFKPAKFIIKSFGESITILPSIGGKAVEIGERIAISPNTTVNFGDLVCIAQKSNDEKIHLKIDRIAEVAPGEELIRIPVIDNSETSNVHIDNVDKLNNILLREENKNKVILFDYIFNPSDNHSLDSLNYIYKDYLARYHLHGNFNVENDKPTLPENTIVIDDGSTFTIQKGKTLSVNTYNQIENNGILNNNGIVNLNTTNLFVNGGTGVINNYQGGTINLLVKGAYIQNDGTINNYEGATINMIEGAYINNYGTINKHEGSAITGEVRENPVNNIAKPKPIIPDTTPDNKPSYDYEPAPDIIVDTSADDFADGGNVNISGFDGVPDDLKTKYGSVRDMMKYTKQAIAEYFEKAFKNIKFNAENTVFFNAELKPDADGNVYLPVPKNVDATKNKFVVAHIMDNGLIEVVEGKVTENGIEVTLNGLSPVMITWFSSDLSAGEGMVEVEESL